MSASDRWRNEGRHRDDEFDGRERNTDDGQSMYRSRDYGRREGGRSHQFGSGRESHEDYGRGSDFSGSGFGQDRSFGRSDHGRGSSGWREDDRDAGSFGYGNYGHSGPFGSSVRHEHNEDFRSGHRGGSGGDDWRGQPSRSRGYGQGDHRRRYGEGDWGDRHREDDRGFWDKASDEVSSWFGDEDAQRRRQQDEHRGRGPKGYTRSDDRIREDVNDRLTDDWRVDASEIDVKVSGGEVTLSGHVTSRDQRRRAEDIAESVSGVSYVQNNVRVKDNRTVGTAGSSQAGAAGSVGQSTAPGQQAGTTTRGSGNS